MLYSITYNLLLYYELYLWLMNVYINCSSVTGQAKSAIAAMKTLFPKRTLFLVHGQVVMFYTMTTGMIFFVSIYFRAIRDPFVSIFNHHHLR